MTYFQLFLKHIKECSFHDTYNILYALHFLLLLLQSKHPLTKSEIKDVHI